MTLSKSHSRRGLAATQPCQEPTKILRNDTVRNFVERLSNPPEGVSPGPGHAKTPPNFAEGQCHSRVYNMGMDRGPPNGYSPMRNKHSHPPLRNKHFPP